ncbi:MAG: Unknown protein [uncultured Aureispira sp.]|uniref:Uncharacterized protein n=1 Tax=uncultured Aureispira sp. TaxID=1331704 RepID=A0A6S6SYR2_9BACT|nr:MAG: Unknown protein [uncultured Aureispira sp.]
MGEPSPRNMKLFKIKFMKLTHYFSGLLLLLVFLQTTSCKKGALEKKPTYNYTYFDYNESITIQFESPVSIGFDIPWIPLSLNDSSSSRVSDPLVETVEDIQLKNMKVTLEDATGTSNKTFYFLSDLDVYVSKGSLPEIKIAHANNISDNVGSVLYLVPEEGVVMDDYVKNGDYQIRMDISTKNLPSLGTLTLRADMVFDVRLINAQK